MKCICTIKNQCLQANFVDALIQACVDESDTLRIHQKLFTVEVSFASNSFIIKNNFIKVYIIRKLVKVTI